MSTARATTLYTPDILAAAVALADYPLDPSLPLEGEARSRSCGSSLVLRLATAGDGRIVGVGCAARACAVGQAAAAIFARAACGRDRAGIVAAREALAAWLAGEGDAPDWPGVALLDAARRFPGRLGAVLLAWDAALGALAFGQEPRGATGGEYAAWPSTGLMLSGGNEKRLARSQPTNLRSA
jgi:NifU-like protein involved in Fe-S cluster formation